MRTGNLHNLSIEIVLSGLYAGRMRANTGYSFIALRIKIKSHAQVSKSKVDDVLDNAREFRDGTIFLLFRTNHSSSSSG